MEFKEVYEEYKSEHPEELTGVQALFAQSERVELDRERRRKEKLATVNAWREKLYGKESTR